MCIRCYSTVYLCTFLYVHSLCTFEKQQKPKLIGLLDNTNELPHHENHELHYY
jgi:hypothetical protein